MKAKCEHSDRLRKFLSGDSSDEWHELECHLEDCPECRATIDAFSCETDPVLSAVQSVIAARLTDQSISGESTQPFVDRIRARILHRLQAGSIDTEPPLPIIPGCSNLRLVGRGGMGLVYQADHDVLKIRVAVKVLRRGSESDARRIARFVREIQSHAQLRSEHIVAVRDAGNINNDPYVIMDWIEGADVEQVARRCGSLSICDACEIVHQAALGLSHAHEFRNSEAVGGLIHRDIKPSNLLLSNEGCVLVADFGLAIEAVPQRSGEEVTLEAADRLTQDSEFVGTLNYVAPEQCNKNKSVDARTDLYSLGLTLWRLLSGQVPFEGPKYRAAVFKLLPHRGEDVTDVRQLRPDVPRSLATLIKRMTNIDPDRRPKSASEVARQLEPFCRGADLKSLIRRACDPAMPAPTETQSQTEQPTARQLLGMGLVLAAVAVVIVVIKTDRGDVSVEVDTTTGQVTRIEQPAAPHSNVNTVQPSTPAIDVAHEGRSVLLRVLELGGQVMTRDAVTGGIRTFGKSSRLPDDLSGVYRIEVINTSQLRNEDLAGLVQFPDLEILHLNGTPLTDDAFIHVGQLKHLRELTLFSTQITDAGLAHLQDLSQLQTLHLALTDITDEGLEHLSKMQQLEWLALVKCRRLTGTGFRHLEQLQKLKYLDMNMTALSDEGLRWICRLQSIEQLHATNTPISDAGLAYVAQLVRLKEFHPNDTRLTDDGIIQLSACRNLEGLGLNGTRATDRSLAVIATLPRLRLLALQYTSVTAKGLDELAKCQQLTSLLLTGTKASDEGVARLRQQLPRCLIDFPSRDHRVADRCLEFGGKVQFHGQQSILDHRSKLVRNDAALIQTIDLTDRKLPPDLIPAIASLQSLHSLNLSGTLVSEKDIQRIATSPELAYLWLVDTKVGDTAIRHLSATSTLQVLDLSGTKVTDNALASLPENILSLHLNRTSVTDAGLAHLVRLKRMTELRIEDTAATADGIASISVHLPDCLISR